MDIGSVAKPPIPTSAAQRPSNPVAVAAVTRTDVATPSAPAPTELDADRAVTRVGETDAVRVDISEDAGRRAALDAALKRVLERRNEVDEATNALVTRTVDRLTGEVVEQIPAESLLKLRAYIRAPDPDAEPGAAPERRFLTAAECDAEPATVR